MLDRLNTKKAALVAQRDQAVANLNALVGAIQFCDELIADAVTEQIVAKAAEQEALQVAPEMPSVTRFEPCAECPDSQYCDDIDICAVK